ncbi:hypothetical protein AUC71_02450 [Methyloceanibacter marginalis]|jgi:hypothetical protein|uniref:Uncharacterized protein n=1 Tax=Methyloceanibacter marginalis TaxID=1774971 RepID=A0A1E3W8E1_9HYPH|nr:hypothetical protein [Methyloceanibacter marginalis]ODS02088.1 hypothetical protein AUC71_02450 [Methyloceanibacter marginalis]
MPYDEDSYELSLTATARLLYLLQRLTEDEVLEREAALAILGNAAEALISNPIEMMEVHYKASTLICEEIVPRVRENLHRERMSELSERMGAP